MNKNTTIIIITAVVVLGMAAGVYFVFFHKEGSFSNVNNANTSEDINALGTHELNDMQKAKLGLSSADKATIEVIETNTSPGATIRILDVKPGLRRAADSDGDGLADIDEIDTYGTDPNNMDSDSDGVFDGREVNLGLDPNNPDTYNTGRGDYQELISNPLFVTDSDRDGLSDGEEKNLGTDPNKLDTDGDGYSDGVEVQNGYNPLGEE